MSAVYELVRSLQDRQVRLWVEDRRLMYDAPSGTLQQSDLVRLRELKAEIVDFLAQANAPALVPRLSARSRGGLVALSFEQERLWFVDQMEGANAAYQLKCALRLSGELDEGALGAALDEIERRHEVLRTVFVSEQGEARQQVREASGFALEVEDVRGVRAEDREQVVRERMHGESVRGFDLGAGPLIRGRLLRVEDEQHVLLITMHHIISDGWSLGVLLKELSELYGAYVGGRESPLEELPIQYADYAQWQREWLQGELLQEQLGYWKGHLAGAPALLELPTDRARPARQSYAGGSVAFDLGEQLTRDLKGLARRFDLTLFMLLYAGWAVLLSRLSGQEDVVIGTAVANRARTEVEGLIGFFVNTLALRVRVSGESRVEQLLQQVRQLTLAGYAHQEAPFEQVVDLLGPQRTMAHSPLFQVELTLQRVKQDQFQAGHLQFNVDEISIEAAKFDLSLSLHETSELLRGGLTYSSDLFERSTIERWVGYFKALLAQFAAAPLQPVDFAALVTGMPDQLATNPGTPERFRCYVLDASHRELPVDIVGQVYSEDPGAHGTALQGAARESTVQLADGKTRTVYATSARGRRRVDGRVEPVRQRSAEASDAALPVAFAAPQGELEESLGRIWCELLRIERVGRGDSFFALGGYSLLAVRLLARLRQQLGRTVSIAQLFEGPTIQALAQHLSGAAVVCVGRIVRGERVGTLPLSLSQQRLWFIDQLQGQSAAYRIAGAVRLSGELNEDALGAALDEIERRHEVLRTVFVSEQGEARQQVREASGFALEVEDVRGVRAEDREQVVRERMHGESVRGFDLGAGPLIRGRLLRVEDEQHVLLITMHHIISDGWSLGVLLKELSELYGAYVGGRESPLEELPIQYADYAQWQREWLQGELLQEQLGYWKGHLAGAPALLELPTDRARPARQSYAGGSVAFDLGEQLTRDLKGLARRFDLTLFMLLYAGWAVLLSRLSAQEDVVIGTAVANRARTEVEGLIGCFVNTLALRVRVSGESRVEQLLQQVRQLTLAGYAHQEAPFEQVVEVVQPPRSLSHSALFQTMLVMQNTPQEQLSLAGLRLQGQELSGALAQFDLTLSVRESATQISASLNYASALFDEETIERWVGHLRVLLASLVEADAQSRVQELRWLSEPQEQALIVGMNGTQRAYPQEQLLHELFEAQVRLTPQAVALRYEQQQLTYGQLNARANQLARWLRQQGVEAEQRVGLCVRRGVEMVVGVLGVLKAGAAYVPLDPGYPAQRLQYMLEDAAPRVVLTQGGVNVGVGGAVRLELDTQWESEVGVHEEANLALGGQHARQLAYVIYTSGSTGQPKGVMVEHTSVVNLLCAMREIYRLQPQDRVLQLVAFSFDVASEEILSCLVSGAALILRGEDWLNEPRRFWALCATHEISVAHIPAALIGQLLESENTPVPKSIRVLVTGGERIKVPALRSRLPSVPLVLNEYGPTETTITASVHEVRHASQGALIGRPIWNTRIYVLDGGGRAVPVGVAGEIYIAGAGVARGYLNREQLTQERFVRDPFSEEAGARMYRTGDVGRWVASGELEYLGRNDQQVKLRGFRIELGEIEGQLLQHERVREAAVLVREAGPGEQQLVAYYTSGEGALSTQLLRGHLGERLPQYMVPAAYVWLQELPLTPNGKLDRGALPAPDSEAYSQREYEAPQGETQCALAQIWSELLRIERVGRNDNFFELGGHSLLIMKLLEHLKQRGWLLQLRDVFDAPVLGDLAARLRRWQGDGCIVPPNLISGLITGTGSAITPQMLPLADLEQAHIDRIIQQTPGGASNIQDIYPLSPLQEGILFHHLLSTAGDAYVLPILLEVDSTARLHVLFDALQAVIDRHDVLRTAVLWEQLPRAMQIVHRHAVLPVQEIEYSSVEHPLGHVRHSMLPQEARIDLRHAPLLRVRCATDRVSGRSQVLLLLHHICSDHIGLEVILRELRALLEGRGSQLGQPTPYRNFVARSLWQAKQVDAEAFFRRKLGEVEEPTAPFGLLDVHGDGSGIEQHRESLEPALSGLIRRLVRGLGVSAATVFHAAWAIVVGRCSGREDVVFGTVLLGRWQQSAGAERAVGMFMNTLPLRVRLGEARVGELVEQVHREIVELLDYDQASLALAQRCSAIAGTAPLFTALFNYRHSVAEPGDASPRGISVLAVQERTNYPVHMAVDDQPDTFTLTAQTDPRIDARRVTGYLHTVLKALVRALEREPDTRVAELPMLSDPELQQLIGRFSSEPAQPAGSGSIHGLFESQAASTPQALAVVCGPEQLTYEQLNRRANQLAHRLRAAGVGPDDLVALCMQRSVDMMVALLGVLKAGGAYVPLDPTYPRERLAYMLADAAPAVLLTQSTLAASLPTGNLHVIVIDAERSQLEAQPQHNPECDDAAAAMNNLAYVIYTSGSTGQPKGVMVEHQGVTNLLTWMQRELGVTASDRLLAITTLSFDIAGLELYLPLLAGARVVIAQRGEVSNAQALIRLLEVHDITLMQATPATWRMLLDARWAGRRQMKALCGGEALPGDLARRIQQSTHSLWNVYGPTETTIWSCQHRLQHVDDTAVVPIGRPIANTHIYLTDERGRCVPQGVGGEICIGGMGVARGYWRQPQLTAQKFVANPHVADPAARMYRTGDLGRWQADGTLEFLGRMDHQVKIRGFRIDLGEVETRLRTHPRIQDAVVVAQGQEQADKRLVAYFVSAPAGAPDPDVLRTYISECLPEYMVPAAYVPLAAFPLTPNGKLDRSALIASTAAPYSGRAFEAPHAGAEQALAAIWRDLLQLERLGRNDNVFELGANSLLATRFHLTVNEQYRVSMPLSEVFDAPTLAAFCGRLSIALSSAAGTRGTPVQVVEEGWL